MGLLKAVSNKSGNFANRLWECILELPQPCGVNSLSLFGRGTTVSESAPASGIMLWMVSFRLEAPRGPCYQQSVIISFLVVIQF